MQTEQTAQFMLWGEVATYVKIDSEQVFVRLERTGDKVHAATFSTLTVRELSDLNAIIVERAMDVYIETKKEGKL